jgi:hypothetical protein
VDPRQVRRGECAQGRQGASSSSKGTTSERARHLADRAWLTHRSTWRSTSPCQNLLNSGSLSYGCLWGINRSASISNERRVGSRGHCRARGPAGEKYHQRTGVQIQDLTNVCLINSEYFFHWEAIFWSS